ncbi:MAG: hypothetical protein NVSMB9_37330 [Isosphaeraceae bacterium]
MAGEKVRQFVAFDLETTGLVAERDRVVEIGAVRFTADGVEVEHFESLVNPDRPMPADAQAIHGIADADLVEAPRAWDVFPRFLQFLGDPETTVMLAHHAWFDAGFLGRELGRIGLPSPRHSVVDTLALARLRLPQLPNHRLATLARALNLNPEKPHRALTDCRRVKDLWLALEGIEQPSEALVAWLVFDAERAVHIPAGWDAIAEAITRGRTVRIEYAGGTKGPGPREVSPRAIVQRGGVAYMVAVCHLEGIEKSFRLDRVLRHELVG